MSTKLIKPESRKWLYLFLKELQKKDPIMCYEQSRNILLLGSPNSSRLIQKEIFFLDKILEKNTEIEVKNIEIHITFLTKQPKRNIGQLTKFVYKNYPTIRAFIHAFNIIRIHKEYYIAQSWFMEQSYHIIQKFETKEEFNKWWLNKFIKYVKEFSKEPEKLFNLFEYSINNESKKKLIKLIKNADNEMQTEIIMEEKVTDYIYDFKKQLTQSNIGSINWLLPKEINRYVLMNQLVKKIARVIEGQLGGVIIKPKYKNVENALKQNIISRIIIDNTTTSTLGDEPIFIRIKNEFASSVNVFIRDTFKFVGKYSIEKSQKIIFDIIQKEFILASKKVSTRSGEVGGSLSFEKKRNGEIITFTNNAKVESSIINSTYNKLVAQCTPFVQDISTVDNLIISLLLRYEVLGSGGNQWAMPPYVKDALRKEYGINFECFASSINSYYDSYCSMFYDIEQWFGSCGPLQNIEYIGGFYMMNPPYVENALKMMITVVIGALQKSKEPLSFIIGMPDWKNFPAYEEVLQSQYFVRSVKFKEGNTKWYDYITGKYQEIPGNERIILQNEKGRKKWPTDNIETILRKTWI